MKTAIVLAAMCVGLAAAQDRLAETLRKGIAAEESQKDQAAAMESYKSVIAQFDEGRKTAATALFRMAECYRKQHKDAEAKAAYQRLTEQFADQAKLAGQARKALASNYPAPSPEAGREEARNRYRTALLEQIKAAKQNLDYVNMQLKLGAISELDLYSPQSALLKAERELLAFDMDSAPRAAGKK